MIQQRTAPYSGNLDRRCYFEQMTESRTPSGAVTQTWADAGMRWGAQLPEYAAETIRARQLVAEAQHVFVCRGRITLTPKMRLKLVDGAETRYFDILSVSSQDGRSAALSDWITITCKEGQARVI